nr:hypothetical protein [uncultured Pseudomonas sp.]
MMNTRISPTDFIVVAVSGVVIALLLWKLLNQGPRAWWKLPVSLLLNVAIGAAYVDVLDRGSFLFWEFERGISRFAQSISATSFVLALFHAWMGARVP